MGFNSADSHFELNLFKRFFRQCYFVWYFEFTLRVEGSKLCLIRSLRSHLNWLIYRLHLNSGIYCLNFLNGKRHQAQGLYHLNLWGLVQALVGSWRNVSVIIGNS